MKNDEGSKLLAEIKAVQQEHSRELSEIKAVQQEHSKELAELKAVQQEHSKELAELKTVQQEHSKELSEIKAVQQEHSKTLEEHTKILNDLHRSVLVIEDCISNKISVLFDAVVANQEKIVENKTKLDKQEKTTQLHSIKISILEDRMNNAFKEKIN